MVLNPAAVLKNKGLNQEKCKNIANRKTKKNLKSKIQKKNKTRTPNTNHNINKTAQTPGFDWFIYLFFLCFFLVNLHIECFFGDMMWFDCVDFFVFLFMGLPMAACGLFSHSEFELVTYSSIRGFFGFCWSQISLLEPMS